MQSSAADAGFRPWLARHREALIFSVLTIAYLTPIWIFTYLPTQDGPAHLNNAQIFKECGDPSTRSGDYFERREEPMPNLTAHLLLAGLLYLVPPLVAEKLLVSLYIVGFAVAYRFFLGAFGPRCLPLSWLGLLLVYQRCFWMGFYNYCLGMILLWLVLGFCLRRRDTPNLWQALALAVLFLAAYFTHLVAFLLAASGALGIAALASRRRFVALGVVIVASLPAVGLTVFYFASTGFFRGPVPALFVARAPGATTLSQDMGAIDDELYAHHVGTELPGTLVLVFYLVLLAIFTAVESRHKSEDASNWPGRIFPASFGLLLFILYFLVPQHLAEHGGFLKTRLAPLFFLVWIACLRESSYTEVRLFSRVLTLCLLVLNLALVLDTFTSGNRDVRRFTAGIEAVGTGQRLFILQADPIPPPLVDPLLHAADYYCLGTNNVNLDNYQAETLHFPLKYRKGVQRGRNHWNGYSNQEQVDIILHWRPAGTFVRRPPTDWVEIFHQEPLTIYRRP